jgi:hypothetical protein
VFIAKSLVLRNIAFVRYFDVVGDNVRTNLIFAEKLKRKLKKKKKTLLQRIW